MNSVFHQSTPVLSIGGNLGDLYGDLSDDREIWPDISGCYGQIITESRLEDDVTADIEVDCSSKQPHRPLDYRVHSKGYDKWNG